MNDKPIKTCSKKAFTFGILLFHAFYLPGDRNKQFHPYLYISTEEFAAIIKKLLEDGIRFIDPTKLRTPEQQDIEGFWCLLTFDDGYFNNFYILEILEKYNVKALLYPVKEQIEKSELFWWDVFYHHRIKNLPVESVYKEAQKLKTFKSVQIRTILKERFGKNIFHATEDYNRPMTLYELKKFSSHPLIELGVHSNSHEILTNLTREEINYEIGQCKSFLEIITGQHVRHISYPNGNINKSILSVASQIGFETGVTVKRGLNIITLDDTSEKWLSLLRVPIPMPEVNLSVLEQFLDIVKEWKDKYEKNINPDA